MKTFFSICALLLSALMLPSCHWWGTTQKADFLVKGQWKLDSIDLQKSKSPLLAFAMLMWLGDGSSGKTIFDFTDSGVVRLNYNDSVREESFYRTDRESIILKLPSDGTEHSFFVVSNSNNKMEWIGRDIDSLHYYFSRK